MSFMFKPLAYDDPQAINRPALKEDDVRDLTFGTVASGARLARELAPLAKDKGIAVAFDGYAAAKFSDLAGACAQNLHQLGIRTVSLYMDDIYKPTAQIDEMVKDSLPMDYDDDPVLLFGRLYKGRFADFFAPDKLEALKKTLAAVPAGTVALVSGYGSSSAALRGRLDKIVYVDVTPKVAAIRARQGKLTNIGDAAPRPFKEIMRRNYYVDFEVILANRRELLDKKKIDYYVSGDHDDGFVMASMASVRSIMATLAKYPFRAKPVYLDGIWGGEFMRKVRKLPMGSRNVAWIFDLIPMEVSVVVETAGGLFEFPFCTFVQQCGDKIMGAPVVKEFGGYFPIRFNYDDTYHSNGNMSVQVHPDARMCMSRYDEFGSQDEAYYVVATAHGAKTYVGFRKGQDPAEFIATFKKSEKTGKEIDYRKYVNYVDSFPGKQIMLPGGTIHASGRGQLILELGSLTMGSYTYKMYDYNRVDADGQRRPIHSKMAELALHTDRDTDWVNRNIAIEPIPDGKGKGWEQYIVGKTDLMYYYTRRVEMEAGAKAEFSNEGLFTVLSLLDGEECLVYSKSHPEFRYHQKFLDVVVVPADIKDYVIENIGYQPCVVHKTALRPDYAAIRNKQKGMN